MDGLWRNEIGYPEVRRGLVPGPGPVAAEAKSRALGDVMPVRSRVLPTPAAVAVVAVVLSAGAVVVVVMDGVDEVGPGTSRPASDTCEA